VLDPATGEVQVWESPTPRSIPYGLTSAPDGSLWIAHLGTNALGKVNPETGQLTEFRLPAAGARPRRIAVTRDGTVWYTDNARGFLGALNPVTGVVREWQSPSGARSGPYGISIGTDGKVWFNEQSSNLMVGFDPASERMETVLIPTGRVVVRHMVTDVARRRLWLALSGSGRIGMLDLR
jgi:virginiamycin B lyase